MVLLYRLAAVFALLGVFVVGMRSSHADTVRSWERFGPRGELHESRNSNSFFRKKGDALSIAIHRVVEGFVGRDLRVPASIYLTSSPHANAFVRHANSVVFTTELLESLPRLEQVQYVIGHEIAHIALGHTSDASQREEREADALAISILRDINVNPCVGIDTLRILQAKHPVYRTVLSGRVKALRNRLPDRCNAALPRLTG